MSKNVKTYLKWTLIISNLIFLMSCQSLGRSRASGVAIGAIGGAAIGSVVSQGKTQTRNVIIGATVGGLAGGLMGDHLYKKKEQEKRDAFLKGQEITRPDKGMAPNIRPPKVETYWIEGKAVGNRYIEGHYEYVIMEPSRWDVE